MRCSVKTLSFREERNSDEMSSSSRGGNRRRRRWGGLAALHHSPASTDLESPIPHRSLLSRWFHKPPASSGDGGYRGTLGCRVRFPRYRSKKKKGEVASPSIADPAAEPTPPLGSELSLPSERKPEEFSANVCIGWSLVFLLAKSTTELNKMIELQKQMELLLKDIKKNVQRMDSASSFRVSNNNISSSASNCFMNESISNPSLFENDRASYHLVGAHIDMEIGSQSKCESTFKDKQCQRMNQLEEELEVEIGRLQLNLEGENSSILPHQHRMKLISETSDPCESYNISFVEADEAKDEDSSRQCGVSPRELERRLHELLETRQQERIVELESALECAEKKLGEKEGEISWWRDTASLVSKHKDEKLLR